jgi:hypothetical protein
VGGQVIEGMRERKFGCVIKISSINGQKGQFGETSSMLRERHCSPGPGLRHRFNCPNSNWLRLSAV